MKSRKFVDIEEYSLLHITVLQTDHTRNKDILEVPRDCNSKTIFAVEKCFLAEQKWMS